MSDLKTPAVNIFDDTLGKAAHTMAVAFRDAISRDLDGIVVTPHPIADPVRGCRYVVGGHPLPTEASFQAGMHVTELLQGCGDSDLVVFLISGGGSALVESPLSPITRDELILTYRALLHSGAPISEMNAVRKHLSALKGGRMAQLASPAAQVSLLVSDVPDDSVDALASGPTMPDSSTRQDCIELLNRYKLWDQLPENVRGCIRTGHESPKSGDSAFDRSAWQVLLSPSAVASTAAAFATQLGFEVEIDNSCDDWEYAAAADYLLKKVRSLRRQHARVCLISVGEVTVSISGNPGTGGRNQQFALYAAQQIADDNIAVLSAGTDGIDGNSVAAGAIVDGQTLIELGEAQAISALQNFDAYPLLKSAGATIETGPSGNNLRDLRILLAN